MSLTMRLTTLFLHYIKTHLKLGYQLTLPVEVIQANNTAPLSQVEHSIVASVNEENISQHDTHSAFGSRRKNLL